MLHLQFLQKLNASILLSEFPLFEIDAKLKKCFLKWHGL